MAYTDIDKPTDYFNTKLYSGDATNPTTISGIGFQPDWVWTKLRSGGTEAHRLCDAVRGVTKDLFSDATDGEATNTIGLKSFNSDGYVIGNSNGYNLNSGTFVSWNWLAGTSVSGTTTGSGTGKAYSGSVSTDAGFSIIKYIGNGTAGHTIPHHLGAVPKMFIVKRINASGGWVVYHENVGNTKIIELHDSAASQTSSAAWNNTSPSSTTFTLGDYTSTNTNDGTYIAYCFSEKKGFSKMGSYVGIASSDSNFVFLGFKPAFLLIKNISSGSTNWHMYDNKRLGYNVDNNMLRANLNNASQTDDDIDLLSNGFKLRRSTSALNNSGDTFIYYAVAENPFVTSTGIPTTAR